MIVDRQGRRFRNLRISLTAACNYACTYCVPDGKRLVAAQNELSADAMAPHPFRDHASRRRQARGDR